jgi:hypothetical protein
VEGLVLEPIAQARSRTRILLLFRIVGAKLQDPSLQEARTLPLKSLFRKENSGEHGKSSTVSRGLGDAPWGLGAPGASANGPIGAHYRSGIAAPSADNPGEGQ